MELGGCGGGGRVCGGEGGCVAGRKGVFMEAIGCVWMRENVCVEAGGPAGS